MTKSIPRGIWSKYRVKKRDSSNQYRKQVTRIKPGFTTSVTHHNFKKNVQPLIVYMKNTNNTKLRERGKPIAKLQIDFSGSSIACRTRSEPVFKALDSKLYQSKNSSSNLRVAYLIRGASLSTTVLSNEHGRAHTGRAHTHVDVVLYDTTMFVLTSSTIMLFFSLEIFFFFPFFMFSFSFWTDSSVTCLFHILR